MFGFPSSVKIDTASHTRTHEVMVTAGANQAFVNIALAAMDEGDACVLFKPFFGCSFD